MYTLYYVSEDVYLTKTGLVPMGTWSVYSEQYAKFEDEEPIEGSTVHVSGNHTEDEANTKAAALQRQSYGANRKAAQ